MALLVGQHLVGVTQVRINGFHGPRTGAARSGRFLSGGTADIGAWRTVRRCTR